MLLQSLDLVNKSQILPLFKRVARIFSGERQGVD
jgi:hypothetical protein